MIRSKITLATSSMPSSRIGVSSEAQPGSLRLVIRSAALAQQAAYVEPRIRHVYAFDPSVVTGSSDARVRQALSETGPGLRIDRIYEHGEALAYLRFAQRQLAPASACNPQIRTIRFDAVHGGPIGQHTLSGLIGGLLRLSGESHHGSRQTTLPDNAECRPAGAIVSASAR